MNALRILAFSVSLMSLVVSLSALLFALRNKNLQFWPPPKKSSWQYYTFWTVFRIAIWSGIITAIATWNQFVFPDFLRFGIGLPLLLLGMGIAFYGYFIDLGIKNTQGLKEGLRTSGLYQYSRNPQYTAGIVGFIGTALVVNSVQLIILCLLLSLLYLLLPFLEEPWLEKQYGEAYSHYKLRTPRFLFK